MTWDSEGDGILDPVRAGTLGYVWNFGVVRAKQRGQSCYLSPNANEWGQWGLFDAPVRNALVLQIDQTGDVGVLQVAHGKWSGYYTDLLTEAELIDYAARRGQALESVTPTNGAINTKESVPA